jgi:hypothetical protein
MHTDKKQLGVERRTLLSSAAGGPEAGIRKDLAALLDFSATLHFCVVRPQGHGLGESLKDREGLYGVPNTLGSCGFSPGFRKISSFMSRTHVLPAI